jgi:hypothetical protein
MVGIYWKCIECEDAILLCFKCFDSRTIMHNPLHEFGEIDGTQTSRHTSRPVSGMEQLPDNLDVSDGEKDIGDRFASEEPKSDTSSEEGGEGEDEDEGEEEQEEEEDEEEDEEE